MSYVFVVYQSPIAPPPSLSLSNQPQHQSALLFLLSYGPLLVGLEVHDVHFIKAYQRLEQPYVRFCQQFTGQKAMLTQDRLTSVERRKQLLCGPHSGNTSRSLFNFFEPLDTRTDD